MEFFEMLLYTLFLTPIVFIVSFIGIIDAIHNKEGYKEKLIACVISFWLMVVPTFFVILSAIQY